MGLIVQKENKLKKWEWDYNHVYRKRGKEWQFDGAAGKDKTECVKIERNVIINLTNIIYFNERNKQETSLINVRSYKAKSRRQTETILQLQT